MFNNHSRKIRGFRPSPTGFYHPAQRFSHSRRPRTSKITDPTVFIRKSQELTSQPYIPTHSFADFPLVNVLKQNIKNHNYLTPTPIQDQAIGPILEGRDVIGLAATGTGKTAAFLVPLIDNIFKTRNDRVLIIVPTRELALQINEQFRVLAKDMKLYSALIIGGVNINRQIHDIRRNPHVVIATPGRLRDLVERRVIYLEDYSKVVLDEVDLMVDIGFIDDVRFFISLLPQDRQSLFFSATIPSKIQTILHSFVKNPVTISVNKQAPAENVDQDIIRVTHPTQKVNQLHDLLIKDGFDKVLIFGRTKHGVDRLHRELDFRGFKAGAIHGNKTQSQRQKILESFKNNHIQILLATDVASRGLDIDNVTHVINYELPETFEDYIHRIGRTGRADKKGIALTFID